MTVLLMSGAYVSDELVAEFGKLPASFLPAGNKRLFELQSALLASLGRPMVMTIPEDFEVSEFDLLRLAKLKIEILPAPSGLKLSEAIIYALNTIGCWSDPISIMHGDTYFSKTLPFKSDVVLVDTALGNYNWAALDPNRSPGERFLKTDSDGNSLSVLCGYFAFSDCSLLIRSMTKAKGDFVEGLNRYDNEKMLQAEVLDAEWLDFGHVQTYYRSRWCLSTQRQFNNLRIDRDVVTKTSAITHKVNAEANWFENLPIQLKPFAATFLARYQSDEGSVGYQVQHEYLAPLSDLFVFGALPNGTWREIFNSCADFVDICSRHKPNFSQRDQLGKLYLEKALSRIGAYCKQEGISDREGWTINGHSLPGLLHLAEELAQIVGLPTRADEAIMHGDLCFSNILYDFRRGAIKLIDPRGYVEEANPTIFGDTRYDLAKLNHSVIGLYDHIVAGNYKLTNVSGRRLELELPTHASILRIREIFKQTNFGGRRPEGREIGAATALLFLSMLPLHAEDRERQRALLARGLMLATEVL